MKYSLRPFRLNSDKNKKGFLCLNPKNLVFGEFIGLMKISKFTAVQLIEQYNHLQDCHQGKFHDSPSIQFGIITDMINELLKNGIKFSPTKISGRWCEIDTPEDLENAKELFKN